MPARDLLHDAVRNALVRDGWTITDDPLRLKVPGRNLYVDPQKEVIVQWVPSTPGEMQSFAS